MANGGIEKLNLDIDKLNLFAGTSQGTFIKKSKFWWNPGGQFFSRQHKNLIAKVLCWNLILKRLMIIWLEISFFGFLKKMGFGAKRRMWMLRCSTNSSFSILINGETKGFFRRSRGLRQRDPLSPFIFILAVLNLMLLQAKHQNMFSGFIVKWDGTQVTHLQFVNDTVLLVNAKKLNSCFFKILWPFSVHALGWR